MGTERSRRRARHVVAHPARLAHAIPAVGHAPAASATLLALATSASALLALATPAPAYASTAWWQPLAFAGQRISAVSAAPAHIIVDTPSGRFASSDGGATFSPTTDSLAPALPVLTANTIWDIRNGTVLTGPKLSGIGEAVGNPDPGAPNLGAGAHILAAPAAAPGVVLAVGTDNHVWRRAQSGMWATAFIPLPAGGVSGTPRISALAAFTQPLSAAVYMGVDGYGVLLTNDGGDDWIRADPGLPENVLGLATDNAAKALYAATDQGLYVHHLQALPAPPAYTDAQLYVKWLGIAGVALVAVLIALLAMRRLLPRAAT